MARYVHVDDLDALASQFGITRQQVKSFISTHRENGNIQAVNQYIDDHPGTSETEIENNAVDGQTLDAQVVQGILGILLYVSLIEEI